MRTRFLLHLLLALVVVLAAPGRADAIQIQLVYDPGSDGVDPCQTYVITPEGEIGLVEACHALIDRTPDLTLHLGVAAVYWQNVFKDDHDLTIRYRWVLESLPSANVIATDAQGRPIEGIVRVPANFKYYYDPNPLDDDEFPMSPKLYRTLHPDEQAEAISGTPPEVFEVAYVGTNKDLHADLLTILFHEVGHIVGLESDVWGAEPATCVPEAAGAYHELDPLWVGGAAVALKAHEFIDDGQTKFDCSHLALGGIEACKTDPDQPTLSEEPSDIGCLTVRECTSHQSLFWSGIYPSSRQRPETAGIFAIARAAGWQIIDLPRKFSLGSGQWEEASTWLGNRVPDVDDDVYIVNRLGADDVCAAQGVPATVKLFDAGAARNLTISGGNRLELFFAPLDVGGTVRVGPAGPTPLAGTGSSLTVDTSATLEASHVEVFAGSRLDVAYNGFADIFRLSSRGVIRGAGAIEASLLQNNGTIRGNGDTPLVFTTSNPNPAFDLTGTSGISIIEALVGDLVFDGKLTAPVTATISVGGGRAITFTQGWQQWSAYPAQRLRLNNGSPFDAVVHGPSTIGGTVELDGVGRFTASVVFQPSALLLVDIGGTEPGSGHDQLGVGQLAQLAGDLAVSLVLGYQPSPGDTFAVLTAGSVVGDFDTFTATLIPGGLQFVPQYGPTAVTLLVGFQGGTPGTPNCQSNVIDQQVSLHGSVKKAAQFHGLTVKALKEKIKTFCGG
jgi:hypothetical protein